MKKEMKYFSQICEKAVGGGLFKLKTTSVFEQITLNHTFISGGKHEIWKNKR